MKIEKKALITLLNYLKSNSKDLKTLQSKSMWILNLLDL